MISPAQYDAKRIWLDGYGVIHHSPETVTRIEAMITALNQKKITGDRVDPYTLLAAADRLSSAAMWLVVQSSYVRHVYLDGRELAKDDFKPAPEGHVGGSLNMVPAYVGYLLINALTGLTRGWTMAQGHTVSAIDSCNLLVGNMLPAHESRYDVTDAGLSRFTQDFYSYRLNSRGKQDSPRGSHVNQHTAGGIAESGYLGFTSVQYMHMPLKGERLVAFLSDGSFEEQRGSDWSPRFWRSEDSGYPIPFMIVNGRRIDQRTTLSQEGSPDWFIRFLQLHRFDPITIDGTDPSAAAWLIYESERRFEEISNEKGKHQYPALMPYGLAVAPKGYGFYNAGTNSSHDLPLDTSPYEDSFSRDLYNQYIGRLWVPKSELFPACQKFGRHEFSGRVREKDNSLANRDVTLGIIPEITAKNIAKDRTNPEQWTYAAAMEAIDEGFVKLVKANPSLRVRVGNPDELRSNRMKTTLEELKFRVTDVEAGNEEAVDGKIITVLNEEAVAGAAFGNKGGINIIVTYEAFGAKMIGEARQEIIFSQHQKEDGRKPGWLSVPIILASHTWENGKNEQSHQDPSMAEVMLGENSDISRVVFPADYNSAAVTLRNVYQTRGQVWTVVASKRPSPNFFTYEEAEHLVADGAIRLNFMEYQAPTAKLSLIALGTYQLWAVIRAPRRLKAAGISHTISYLYEPGRFRFGRSNDEKAHLAPPVTCQAILPDYIKNVVLVTHTRPEPLVGLLQPLLAKKEVAPLGFINQGGTLGATGLLFANRCSWLHILSEAARLTGTPSENILSPEELRILNGLQSPDSIH